MAGQRNFASESSDSSRCQKTDGRRWRCPMPAQPNKSFCSHHRLTTIKTPPSSVQQNPGRVSDHKYIGPNESEEDSQPDNPGSYKKRRRRKEMAVSDLVAERTPDPVSTKTSGIKKKKTARSGAKRVSDSLDLDKGAANLKNSSVVEVDLVLEKSDVAPDPVETIKKKRSRTKKKFVDSDDLLDLEAKRESRAESEIEKIDNGLDEAADVTMDSGVEETVRVLDLENGGHSVNHNHNNSDVKIGVEMDEQTNNDTLDMLDSKINKGKTTIGGDLDNFEVYSGKESIIETDSGLDKVSENLDLLEANKKKRGMIMKTTDSDIEKNVSLEYNMMAKTGGVFIAKVLEMNGAEKVDIEMNLDNKCDQMLDQHHKNDKIQKKETVLSYVEKINHLMRGKSVDMDVQNLETNSDKTAEKTGVEMGFSGGKDKCNLDMLEKNKKKGGKKEEGTASKLEKDNRNLDIIGMIKKRGKECVLEVEGLEKSTDAVADVGVSIQLTSGHENDVNLDPNKKKTIEEDDTEAPKVSQNSDETSAVEISGEKCMGLEKSHQILDMFGTDKNSNQSVENSNLDGHNQISRRKRGKEVSNRSEVDSDVEMLNQTLGSFKKNKKRNRIENKRDIMEESEAELDPLTLDLMRIALKRQMEKMEEKNRKEKETEIIELPNGIMAISPRRNNFPIDTVYAVDRKVGLVVGDNCLYQRRFRSKNVEPEPVAVVKKLPMGPRASRGLKKGTCIQKSDKTDMRRGTGTSISKELKIVQNRSSSIQCTDYMIGQLRPVLKLLDWEQVLELEIEAKNQGENLASVRVQTIECSQDMQYKCNFCRVLIVSLLRGCSNCCYKLCLSCCQEIRGMNLPEEAYIMTSDHHIGQKHNDHFADMNDRMKNEPSSFKTRDEQIPCPPSGLGGCGEDVLIMKLLLPFGLLGSVEGGIHSG